MTAGRGPVEMVLSPVVFRDVLWTIDYARGRMTMEEGQSLPPPDGKEILPLQMGTGNKLLIPGSIAGQEVWLVVDTGFSGALAIPQWAMGAFPGTSGAIATGEVHYYFGKGTYKISRMASDLTLGRHRIVRPLFMPEMGRDPTIGAEYLRQFTITIDQRNQRIRLHRVGDQPIRTAAESSASFGTAAR
jgi:predicted aspartyl protease